MNFTLKSSKYLKIGNSLSHSGDGKQDNMPLREMLIVKDATKGTNHIKVTFEYNGSEYNAYIRPAEGLAPEIAHEYLDVIMSAKNDLLEKTFVELANYLFEIPKDTRPE